MTGGHVDPASLRATLERLAVQQRVLAAPHGAVSVGSETIVTATKQHAFVCSLRLAAVADSFLVDDVDVATFEHGMLLRIAARQDGDRVQLDLEWCVRVPVLPMAVAGDLHGRLQVPVLTSLRVTASTCVAPNDSLVIASLPGGEPGSVQILCVETEVAGTLVTAR